MATTIKTRIRKREFVQRFQRRLIDNMVKFRPLGNPDEKTRTIEFDFFNKFLMDKDSVNVVVQLFLDEIMKSLYDCDVLYLNGFGKFEKLLKHSRADTKNFVKGEKCGYKVRFTAVNLFYEILERAFEDDGGND